jgi:hypothetical protein
MHISPQVTYFFYDWLKAVFVKRTTAEKRIPVVNRAARVQQLGLRGFGFSQLVFPWPKCDHKERM